MENNKNTKLKTEKKFINGLEFEIQEIEINKLDGIKIEKIKCCDKEYKVEIKHNDDRGAYLTSISHNGRKYSLSFFKNISTAQSNAYLYIALKNGAEIHNSNNKIGD